MTLKINVLRQAGGWGRRIKNPEVWAKKVGRLALDETSAEINIVFSNDAHIRILNHNFRGINKPTNVLSFPSGEKEILGDVVLAEETIARESKAQGKTFQNHAAHLLIHGILHLLGHGHQSTKEANLMEGLEVRLLSKLGIANPY